MVGRFSAEIRETCRGQAVFMAEPELTGPKSRPAGVSASVVAAKRVTTVKRRDAGKWLRDDTEQRLNLGESGGDASTSRRHPSPVGLGETFGLDRAQVDAAHLRGVSRPGRGLRAVGCRPWQKHTSGRGQSQVYEPTGWRAGAVCRARHRQVREIRPSGSEGGARFQPWSLPLS